MTKGPLIGHLPRPYDTPADLRSVDKWTDVRYCWPRKPALTDLWCRFQRPEPLAGAFLVAE